MSITTYSELKTAVANWLNRSDLTDRIPEFITMAETRINYGDKTKGYESPPVRSIWNEASTTLTATAGTSYIALPSDFLEAKEVHITVSGDQYPVEVYSAENQTTLKGEEGNNRPTSYSIYSDSGTSYIQFYSPPDSNYSIPLKYYKKFTGFTSGSDTNTLLTQAPGVYLHGTLTEAYLYTRNLEMASIEASRTSGLIEGINDAMRRRRFGKGKMAARPGHGSP